jgi:hypothetical protein
MPYIKQEHRPRIDTHIEALASEIKKIAQEQNDPHAFAGMLNYSCTRLALQLIPEKRYWAISLVAGVFRNIGDEFYRRYAAPYEDQQIEKNGEVYD